VKPAECASYHCGPVLPNCEMRCDWYIERGMLSLHTVGQCVKMVSAVWGNTLWSRHVAVYIDPHDTLIIPAFPQLISLEKGEEAPRCWICIGWSLARIYYARGTCGKNMKMRRDGFWPVAHSVMCFLGQCVEVFISFNCQRCCTIFLKTRNFCWWFEEMHMKTEVQKYDWNVHSNIWDYAVLVISV